MSPPNKNAYWLGVITTFCLVSTSSYFASSSIEFSFLSQRIAFRNFFDYSPLVLICISVSFSFVLLRFCFFFFFFNSLSFHFLLAKHSFHFRGDLVWTATTFLSPFSVYSLEIFISSSAVPTLTSGPGSASIHICNIFAQH